MSSNQETGIYPEEVYPEEMHNGGEEEVPEPTDFQRVSVIFRKTVSLQELEDDPSKAIWTISKKGTRPIFGPGKEHILGEVKITSIYSDIPAEMGLNFEYGKAFPVERFYSEGTPVMMSIDPNEKFKNKNFPISLGHNDSESSFLQRYPGRNLSNIEEGFGIVGKTAMIEASPKEHPLIGLINDSRAHQGEAPISEEEFHYVRTDTDTDKYEEETETIPTKYYNMPKKEALDMMKLLKDALAQGLPVGNLYDFKIILFRDVGKSNGGNKQCGTDSTWTSPIGLGTSLSGSVKIGTDLHTNLLQKKRFIKIEVEFEYKEA